MSGVPKQLVQFAVKTTVAISRTQEEIRVLLNKAGATALQFTEAQERSGVAFVLNGSAFRVSLPMPSLASFSRTPTGRPREGGTTAAQNAYNQVVKSRWRAVLLIVKAGVVGVATELGTFHELFTGYMLTVNNTEVRQEVIAMLESGQGVDMKALPGA